MLAQRHHPGQIGFFYGAPSGLIKQQMLGGGGEIGAWLLHLQQGIARVEDAHESILRQICSLMRAPQLFSQPGKQPAVMITVKRGHALGDRGRRGGHENEIC